MIKTLVITGPTACGKTVLAVELALRCGGEVVNADSVQVFEGFDIGAAKPTVGEMRGVPHLLLSVADPREPYTVAQYRHDALAAMEDIHARGKAAIVCGGTGLYIESLFTDRSHAVPPNPELRRDIEAAGNLHARLAALDAASAKAIHPNDTKRLVRALEIVLTTGAPVPRGEGAWQPVPIVALDWPVDALRARIHARAAAMVAAGLVDEVQGLLAQGVGWEAQPMQALGYRQLRPYLEGAVGLDAAVADIALKTAQFAKRQRTYIRGRMPQARWFDAQGKAMEQLAQEVMTCL